MIFPEMVIESSGILGGIGKDKKWAALQAAKTQVVIIKARENFKITLFIFFGFTSAILLK